MTRRIFFIVLFLGFSLMLNSCDQFLDVDAPKNQLLSSDIFADAKTANAALNSIYSRMLNGGQISYLIPFLCGISSDELDNYSTVPDIVAFYSNLIRPDNGYNYSYWINMYNYLYNANAMLEGVGKSIFSDDIRNQLIGEALFLRSFILFYLTNFYGDVPLVTTTDYQKNSILERTDSVGVYRQIISDLEKAGELLNSEFVGADGYTVTLKRVRACKYAAWALLARVQLYTRDYKGAEISSSLIINSDKFRLDSNLNTVFSTNSMEAVFQFETLERNVDVIEATGFTLSGIPSDGDIKCSVLSSGLLSAFESRDRRLDEWVGMHIEGGDTFYYPNKFKQNSFIANNSTPLRLAEQYLIRAEARSYLNNLDGAQADLNVIRKRAGLNNISTRDIGVLRAAILHERQIELFCEWGNRWFDLKRTGSIDEVMSIYAQVKLPGSTWISNMKFFPIPQLERDKNPNLTQNLGYN